MGDHLVLRNISKRLSGLWILRDLAASIESRKVTALIGPNGAGKTTLLHVICGTLKPDTGEVLYEGRNIAGLRQDCIARLGVGRLFQDVRVFSGLSALHNVAVAAIPPSAHRSWAWWTHGRSTSQLLRSAEEEAAEWLKIVGLGDRLHSRAGDLSFGQQKLVGLARMFAHRPSLALLDEPTAGLSHAMVDHMISLIRDAVAKRGLTVLVVEHNMPAVSRLADWVHFLYEGRVAFSGEPRQVLEDKNVREIYMGL